MITEQLTRGRLAGVAMLAAGAAALGGSVEAQAATYYPHSDPVARDAGGAYCPRTGAHGLWAYSCEWRALKVSRVNGLDQHPWINCVYVKSSPFEQHPTCYTARSESDSVTAQVIGEVPIGTGSLSAAVQYNVTRTYTVATSDTVDIPKHKAGEIQWAGVFGDRKKVTQQYEACRQRIGHVGLGALECYPQAHPRSNDYAYAYTEKFIAPAFRFKAKR